MQISLIRFLFCALLIALPAAAQPGNRGMRLAGGRIAYQYTGRIALDFTKGTGVVTGYFTQFAGLPTEALFNGTPSESTAFLTFRADINFLPLPGNGALGPNNFAVLPTLVAPGPFKVYFTANPSHSWNDAASFATGNLIGTFAREGEQFSLIGPIGLNTASAALESSAPFTLGGAERSLRRIVPRGVTNITTGNNVPLSGSTPTAPIFAFADYALTIGD